MEAGGHQRVLKLFLGAGARRRCRREVRGWARLAAAGMATPRLLGELLGGLHDPVHQPSAAALLFDYLPDVRPLAADDHRGVAAAAAVLGRLHHAGLCYRDLHLGNFLQDSRGVVHVVDGDGVGRVAGGRMRRRRSLEELGILCAQRSPLADDRLGEVDRAYAAARGWSAGDRRRLAALAAATVRQRRRRIRRYLRKAQRDCSEFHQHRTWRQWVVAVREAWDPEVAAFAAAPENALHGASVIKDGNSATVFRIRLGGRSRVVKRYNLKGPWHALRRALKPVARFRLAWRNGQRLHFLGIATARPLALVEQRCGPWRGIAYLLMEDLGDRDLAMEVASHGLTPERLAQVSDLFRALSAAGLRHGDTKASNFLVAAGGLALVDLDGMAEGEGNGRDRQRFLENFDHLPDVRERLRAAFAAGPHPAG